MNLSTTSDESRRWAVRFVVFLGIVSLFADMTYEGARSITGPFLQKLGASATIVGIVAGFGELVAYGLRYFTGRITDRTHAYWSITILGYLLNLLAVPLLVFAGNWQLAAFLIILERTGKATRNPARDAMLSYATSATGRGWGFGLHEAMDQTGALIGPLIVAAILHFRSGGYRTAFAWLLLPACCSLITLFLARSQYPRPHDLEVSIIQVDNKISSKQFWLFAGAAAFIAAGYVDFPLIAFHISKHGLLSSSAIPLLYALGMGSAAISALLFGKLSDVLGFWNSIVGICLALTFPLLVFLGSRPLIVVGMIAWGIGLGLQESTVRGLLGKLVPADRRASAYGTFDSAFGVSWFIGSVAMGVLYDHSLQGMIAFSLACQLAGTLLMLRFGRLSTK